MIKKEKKNLNKIAIKRNKRMLQRTGWEQRAGLRFKSERFEKWWLDSFTISLRCSLTSFFISSDCTPGRDFIYLCIFQSGSKRQLQWLLQVWPSGSGVERRGWIQPIAFRLFLDLLISELQEQSSVLRWDLQPPSHPCRQRETLT